ncbi:hypothetical protein QJS10_CPB17g00449 [Acorus calamus]|uniref:Uncharacterized protein n=1 Tax=Acorus calamus TaxID=4465 RepID=A0AAV9CQS2_ACOCL|nr:hypothetical protein QJS10_CPB17g00449 [Acorus calamus]
MVAEKRSSYEEIRQRTIEENKKKLEKLNLTLLTKSLRETASPKPSPVKQVKKRKIDVGSESFERRRSGRLSDKPAPNYRDVYIVRQSAFVESKAVASAPPKLENRRTRKKLVTGN